MGCSSSIWLNFSDLQGHASLGAEYGECLWDAGEGELMQMRMVYRGQCSGIGGMKGRGLVCARHAGEADIKEDWYAGTGNVTGHEERCACMVHH